MKKQSSVPPLVAGILVAALLAAVLVEGGWLVWFPVLLALFVVSTLWSTAQRQ